MGKLYYKYGAMGACKSTEMIIVASKYKEQNRNILVLKPSIDTRSDKGYVESRLGIKEKCLDISKEFDIVSFVKNKEKKESIKYEAIFVDECQFLTLRQVNQLVDLINESDIIVMCYGLKNSYIEGKLFDSVTALLYYADSIAEIKTLCKFCKRKAIHNLRVLNKIAVYKGDEIICGDIEKGDELYVPTCNYHFKNNKYIKEIE